MPKRIQRKRVKGWRMPENTVYIGRPSKFGNPAVVGKIFEGEIIVDAEQAKEKFRDIYERGTWINYRLPSPSDIQKLLAGKDVACFCPIDGPCHGDVLLDIAND